MICDFMGMSLCSDIFPLNRLIGVSSCHQNATDQAILYREDRWTGEAQKWQRFIRILECLRQDAATMQDERVAVQVRENWQVEQIKTI